MKRTPLPPRTARIKSRRVTKGGRGSDPAKVAWIRQLRCLCFASDPMGCKGRVEVHHDRHLGSRATDQRVVPLCGRGHHRLEGSHSVERLGRKRFQEWHGLDLDEQCVLYEHAWQSRKATAATVEAVGIA